MRVKRFVAKSIQEAMVQVKIEMGKEAVILHTRKFKEGGFLGLFAKEFVEVTAAVDYEYTDIKKKNEVKEPLVWPQLAEPGPQQEESTPQEEPNEALEIPEANNSNDLHDMKQLMQNMMDQIEQASVSVSFNKIGDKIYKILINNEVEPKLAKRIVKSTIENIPHTQYENQDYIKEQFIEKICRMLKKPRPIILPKRKQQIFALVGPTGVGKTTTMAKLAANFAIKSNKNIALITADTYRIAAVEQLKAVGEVIGVPVDVVFTPQSIKNSILNHQDKDVILIDTAGRSHKNMMHVSELKGFLEAAQPNEIFLVLSATTKLKDMKEIVGNYQKINFDRIIFTKLDETSSFGTILSIINHTKKYLSYCTTGQSIPDDIEIADQRKLAAWILGDGGSNE